MRSWAWLLLASGPLGLVACGGGSAAGGADGADGAAGADAAGVVDADASNGGAAGADGGSADRPDAADGADTLAPGPLPPWRSGTRLRARLWKVTDAADAVFQSVFDKDLGASCSFVKASDGATRCMPSSAVPYYADVDCKMPVLPLSTGCAPATHVSRLDGCQASGFKVGAKITPAKTFAFDPAGACIEIPLSGTQDFYALTAVAVTGFVAATELRDDRGGNLDMRNWKSDDGGLFPIGAWDMKRGAACVPGTDDYVDHCVPAGVAPVSRSVPAFSDDLCKKPVGYTVSTCGAEPVTAVGMFAPSACGQSMYLAEATRLATTPYRSSSTTCFPWTTPPAGYDFYTPGETISIGGLPDLPSVLEGAGRLKVRHYQTDAAQRIDSNPGFYDALGQGLCLPQDTTRGLRCMSTRAYGVTFYSDDKCAAPVHVEAKSKPDPACGPPRPQVLYVDKGAVCGGLPKLDLYEVGAPVTPAKLYRADGTMGCVADATDPTALDVFGTTPANDTTAAALELVTE